MKNKEITIYELIGLIKDNKAPYEIIYAGTKYYISLENYYKSEDGTSLLESIFNDYNDYDALQEKIEILPEENEMKEMIYQKDRKVEILYHGFYKDYEFYILNLGIYPTAYINVINNKLLAMKDYNDIDISVHGGLTYSEDRLYIDNKELVKGWFIGWDYAHYNDYAGYEMNIQEELRSNGKKWTTEEIYEDVKSVIEQCINYKENDEWEDIDFENYSIVFSEDEIADSFKNFSYGIIYNKELIEKLIKNQKYLKEKLESKDEK